ncbi:MAG: hypothetical protein PHC98_06565 [Syntrophotalea acetylenica]|jgi:rubrerythrin|uniref:Rubrerythrin diiron-binding domain-containing protein n=1 Tax=Syntrophotalea acetylenica TaxID=29542 RepID=A0A1L3GHX7_SYNAC|nr:hypothetical protein [Syntrophotalea acetylenica]APG25537.1 hypothetical protein A7E75_11280 [Syntrophotalea acetylenica]APG43603.1 hypothetical protein A6070_05295 [Syntrophotalea acetylenica]MDD4457235.1 hypothetical protein [Syntrophotalea acetylenica]MDY0262115.1 hypothetical protein [Syntrophotalea acetylenica]
MRGAANFSGFETIRMGMEIAQREHRFFATLARKTRSEPLREIFSGMAQEAIRLYRALRARLGEFSDEGFWDDEEEILPYLQRLPDDLFHAANAVRERLGTLSSDQQALALAIEVEDYLAAYFSRAAGESTHAEGREVFDWLAQTKERQARALRERQVRLVVGREAG